MREGWNREVAMEERERGEEWKGEKRKEGRGKEGEDGRKEQCTNLSVSGNYQV